MVINKLSDKAKVALLGKLDAIIENDPQIEADDSMVLLAELADRLDAEGFCEAANEIDALIEQKNKKLKRPGRMKAKEIRQKFAKNKK